MRNRIDSIWSKYALYTPAQNPIKSNKGSDKLQSSLDVVGIGNAIVDVITRADEAFLADAGLAKGAMTLIDEATAQALYQRMPPGIECSGGSVANSIAGLATLGAATAFIGKVKNDQLGNVFSHDIQSLGVTFRTPPATDGPETARCLILVTPDAQRTMATYLGASIALGPEDIDRSLIKAAKVTYLEGYLWDPPRAKEAFLAAMDIAHATASPSASPTRFASIATARISGRWRSVISTSCSPMRRS
jgi:fructokinase